LHVGSQVSINYSCLALLKQTNMKPVAVNNTIISKKVQKYAMHEKAVWQSAFLNFIVADPDLSQHNFCNSGLCKIARKTFMDSWNKMPKLQEIKLDKTKSVTEKLECAEPIINEFLHSIGQNKSARTKSAISSNRYLTENEEKAIVWIAKIACAAGLGLTREDLLNIINEYVNDGKTDNLAMLVTMEMVTRIIHNNENSLGCISASSLDPKRAKQASTMMRDAFFAKLEAYIGMLHTDGKVLWSFKDIPNECLYNMDELAMDTTKHKQKVLGDKQNRSRTFIITPEGDGKMNHHITVCLM